MNTSISQNKTKKEVQAVCYDLAHKAGSPWPPLLSRRLRKFEHPDRSEVSSGDESSDSSSSSSSTSSSRRRGRTLREHKVGPTEVTHDIFNKLCSIMKDLPEGIKMSYIKALTNAWATSSRHQESTIIHACLAVLDVRIS